LDSLIRKRGILAELWRLPVEIADAIEFHSRPGVQKLPSSDTLLVHLADEYCWQHGLGYGYELRVNMSRPIADLWAPLAESLPKARAYPQEQYTALLEAGMSKALGLADQIFAPTLVST
jgi:hypothetical protein